MSHSRQLPRLTAIVFCLFVFPAAADSLDAGSGCAGGSGIYSSAEVVEGPQRGPLVAASETDCANVAPQGPVPNMQIDVYPFIAPQVGGDGGGVPYERRWSRRY